MFGNRKCITRIEQDVNTLNKFHISACTPCIIQNLITFPYTKLLFCYYQYKLSTKEISHSSRLLVIVTPLFANDYENWIFFRISYLLIKG